MNLLRAAPEHVCLLVCRPSVTDLPDIKLVTKELEALGTTSPVPQVASPIVASGPIGSDYDDYYATTSAVDSTLGENDPGNESDTTWRDSHIAGSTSALKDSTYLASDEESDSASGPDFKSSTPSHSQAAVSPSPTHHSDTVSQNLTRNSKTPSPVKNFLEDAGLSESEASTPRSPTTDNYNFKQEDDREYELTLVKGDKGLGFTVAGSHFTKGYFYVKDVLHDPALSSGLVQSGDRLLVVDGQDMTSMNHREAVTFLRQTPKAVVLRFYRPTSEERDLAETKAKTSAKLSEMGKSESSVTSTETDQPEKNPSNHATVKDKKEPEAKPDPPTQSDIHSEKSDLHSPAPSFGSLSPPLPDTCSNKKPEITKLPASQKSLEDSKTSTNSERASTPQSPTSKTASPLDNKMAPQSEILKVKLQQPDEGGSLGFSLIQGERGISSALFIRSIAPGGIVDQEGTMQIGDRLLQVNGESVIGMPHNKAVTLIKKSSDAPLKLTVTRSCNSTPVQELETKTDHNSRRASQQSRLSGVSAGRRVSTESGVSAGRRVSTESGVSAGRRVSTESGVSAGRRVSTESGVSAGRRVSTESGVSAGRRVSTESGVSAGRRVSTESGVSAGRRVSTESGGQYLSGSNSPDSLLRGAAGSHRTESVDREWETASEEEENTYSKGYTDSESEIFQEGEEDPPEKPPRQNPLSKLPAEISDKWLNSLGLVKIPVESVHYTERECMTTLKHLKARLNNDEPIEEYKKLKHAKLTDNCLEARKQENKAKNRYRNVLPYDANRVKLSEDEDYINASHIRYNIGKSTIRYIATQGPLPQTTGDFWRMIWEQNVEVIAMVVRDSEDGKVKCHPYWPESVMEPFTVWDRFEVSLVQTHHLQHFDIRHLKLEDLLTGRVHRVVHVQFNSWPDVGTPATGMPLLKFLQFLRLVQHSGPLVIHCSAGIGRTGALITIDIILSLMEKDMKFDIQKIVQDLRRQRQGMIQVKDQYNFCYQTAVEVLEGLAANTK